MKTICNALFAIMLLLITAVTAHAQQYPKAIGYVNDFAHLLAREQEMSLNEELAAFEKKTTIEIAVVTTPQLNNKSIESYTRELAKEWDVGKRGQNNGVVFLVAPKERKMRIETASGVHTILTDSRADQIRDNEVLSRFRSGNMAQGIIDGTYAIMQTLDTNAALKTSEESINGSQSQESKSEEIQILLYILDSIVCIALVLYIITSLDQCFTNRKYVLKAQKDIASILALAEKIVTSSDVEHETRATFTNLKNTFSSIESLMAKRFINWEDLRQKLELITYPIYQVTSDMEGEISDAKKARREGPELLKKIPDMIEAVEKKLSEGEPHPKSANYLEKARQQYAQIQTQQSDTVVTNWAAIYKLLKEIQRNITNAEPRPLHTDSQGRHHHSSISHSSDTGSFYGSSDGGFSGGGGSSGGW